MFSKLPKFVLWFILLISENSQSLLHQLFPLLLFSLLFLLKFPISICCTFCSCLTVFGHSTLFSFFFYYYFFFYFFFSSGRNTDIFSISGTLSLAKNLPKSFFIFDAVFLISSIFFYSLLRILTFMFTLCSCMLSPFLIRGLTILIIVILTS